jgi:hypothetical protein
MFDASFWEQSVTFVKEQGWYDLDIRLRGTKGLSKRPVSNRTERAQKLLLFYSILFYSILFYSILFYSILYPCISF